jgi:hypothetical protein
MASLDVIYQQGLQDRASRQDAMESALRCIDIDKAELLESWEAERANDP